MKTNSLNLMNMTLLEKEIEENKKAIKVRYLNLTGIA